MYELIKAFLTLKELLWASTFGFGASLGPMESAAHW